ncbi:MAG: GAF domain-containing protein, partial [Candidatus Babeliales bacterium]
KDVKFLFDCFGQQDLNDFLDLINGLKNLNNECIFEFNGQTSHGIKRVFYSQLKLVEKNQDRTIWNGILTDITSKNRTDKDILKSEKLYQVLAEINQMILYSKNELEIFKQACKIVTEIGPFRMAWVGLVDYGANIIKPVAWTGFEDHYLDHIKISTLQFESEGAGPSGKSFREKKTVVNNDLADNPLYFPWREEALKRGYYSSIALPIMKNDKVIGTFNLYANKKNFFKEAEIKLLEAMADNISIKISPF